MSVVSEKSPYAACKEEHGVTGFQREIRKLLTFYQVSGNKSSRMPSLAASHDQLCAC